MLFGGADILVNNIAWALRHLPVFGVFGTGRYRLQPIHVEDFASLAVQQGRQRPNCIIDAVGPETFTYRELVGTRTTGSSGVLLVAMHPENPFAPAPVLRAPLTTATAVPIAAAAAVPVLASIVHGFALGPLIAGLASAGLFFGGIVTVLRHRSPSIATCLVGGALVGATTGLAWWSLIDTARSLEECVTVGALGGAALLAVELYRAWRRAE